MHAPVPLHAVAPHTPPLAQAPAQQTFPRHKSEPAHASLLVQELPGALRAEQVPVGPGLLHQSALMQSMSLPHDVLQALGPQMYGVQLVIVGAGQLPFEQVEGLVATPPLQLPAEQTPVG